MLKPFSALKGWQQMISTTLWTIHIYNGQVNIFQDSLDRFLSVAQRLKLEGLIGNNDSNQDAPVDEKIYAKEEEEAVDQVSQVTSEEVAHANYKTRGVAPLEKAMISTSPEDVSDVENTVNQYMELCEDGRYKCTLCGKMQKEKGKFQRNLKNHIETHLEGLSFPCQLCGKTFRSRNSYNVHKTQHRR